MQMGFPQVPTNQLASRGPIPAPTFGVKPPDEIWRESQQRPQVTPAKAADSHIRQTIRDNSGFEGKIRTNADWKPVVQDVSKKEGEKYAPKMEGGKKNAPKMEGDKKTPSLSSKEVTKAEPYFHQLPGMQNTPRSSSVTGPLQDRAAGTGIFKVHPSLKSKSAALPTVPKFSKPDPSCQSDHSAFPSIQNPKISTVVKVKPKSLQGLFSY